MVLLQHIIASVNCLMFNLEEQEKWVTLMNESAKYKTQKNLPTQKYSRYVNWYIAARYQLFRLFAVLIAMGIDRRPNIYDYWSMDTFKYTPWYHDIFSRNWFVILYSNMLHVASVGDEQSKKDKIERFLNMLLQNFRNAFYAGKGLSRQNGCGKRKWKVRWKFKMYKPDV